MTVLELLEKKKIYYKISGQDYVISCLNPEHDDSNPSLRIDSVLGIYNCLSCGYKGNLFHHYGEAFDKNTILREQLKRKIEDIRTESIGLLLPDVIQYVDFDYRVSKETLQEFEAFKSIGQDFEGRIAFPIRDLKRNITCFVARAEDTFATPKYKVSPAKSRIPLFPLHKIQPIKGRVILVEGIFDLLNLWDNGLKNVICCFGTRQVTREKLSILKILGVTGIDICFDPDDAGQDAATEIKELAEAEYFNVRNIKLKGNDPGALTPNKVRNLKERLYET